METGNRFFLLFFLIFFFNAHFLYADSQTRGPLNITNNFPTTSFFCNYTPETTFISKKKTLNLRLGITESNTIIRELKGDMGVLMDFELTKIHLNIFTGITDRLEGGIEVPFLIYHKGFMDNPIEYVEDHIGKQSSPRKEYPNNSFRYYLRRNGNTLVDTIDEFYGMGNLILKFKYALLNNSKKFPNLSLKFDVNLPTANEKLFLGKSELGFGTTVLLFQSVKKFHFQLQLGYFNLKDMWIEKLNLNIKTKNFFHGTFSIEYAMKKSSWILQLSANTNPFRRFGIEDIDSSGEAISLGYKYQYSKNSIVQFAITENISTVAFPDFSIDMIMEYRFNL